MRTHIDLDPELIEQVMHMGHFPTKRAAIHEALREYANILKRRELLALKGKLVWEGDLDGLRTNRQQEMP
jgi:Arc/MetJ family transcription regulator